ncbi:MAG: hypothetical protein KDK78_08835 [Chlamydiia bacterium]|nr:hypothetical protein [Chlamydiia bacterium]
MKDILEALKEYIASNLDLSISLMDANDEAPFPHYILEVPTLQQDEPYRMLGLLQLGQTLTDYSAMGETADLFQILYPFPRLIKPTHVKDVERLCQLVNKVSPLPGFVYDEVDKALLFRTALPVPHNRKQWASIPAAITLAIDCIDTFGPTLDNVAQGVEKIDSLIDKATDNFVSDFSNIIKP